MTKPLYPDAMIAAAARAVDADPALMIGPRRYPELVRARWAVMRALHELGWSSARIGRRLGLRDHTTVMRGLTRSWSLYGCDPDFTRLCDEVAAAR